MKKQLLMLGLGLLGSVTMSAQLSSPLPVRSLLMKSMRRLTIIFIVKKKWFANYTNEI